MAKLSETFMSSARRFFRREDGIMAAETLLVVPVFIWAIIGAFTYWDAFRSLNTSQKATYTVSDLITREMIPVDAAYLNGLHDVMQYMVGDDLPVEMRISSVVFSGVRNRYEVEWSFSPYGEMPPYNTATLQAVAFRIPLLADGDSIVLVETEVDFTPAFSMYVGEQMFQQFIVTRPRFVPRICLENVACG